MKGREVSVHITLETILKVLLLGIAVVMLWLLRDLVLMVLTAIVIASAIEPMIRFFMKRKISHIFAVIFSYLIIAIIFFAVLFFFVPPVLNEAASFLTQLPQTLDSLDLSSAAQKYVPWGSVPETLSSASLLQSVSNAIGESTGGVFSTLSAFFGGVLSFVLICVFSFYFSVQETGVDDFLRLVTPVEHEAYVLNLWKRSQHKIGKWMQGQIVLAILVGILLYLGLLLLNVPHALLLAVLAGFFELIPVFGQFLAAIPAVAIGFTAGGITEALLVAGFYTIIQQFEANLIYPLVVKKVVGVPPLLVILSFIIGFKLVGFLGVVLSVPIAGAVQEFVSDVERRKARILARQAAE